MTCHFCNKDFARLKQHLKIKHGVMTDTFEPNTLKSFVLLLNVLPTSQMIMRQQNIINDYLKGNVDLPRELYCEIDRCFVEYKKRRNVKPVLNVGQPKKLKRAYQKEQDASSRDESYKVKRTSQKEQDAPSRYESKKVKRSDEKL